MGIFNEESAEEILAEDQLLKKTIEDNLDYVKSLPVPEYVFYRKWEEVNRGGWDRDAVQHCKENIWMPDDPLDYLRLNPKVIWAKTPTQQSVWEILRVFTSSAYWASNIGRLEKFFIIDQATNKYLGIISLGSDFISVGGRDDYIGWSRERRLTGGLLYTAMGSSIVPTQPFGTNYAGGKLIAMLVLSDTVKNSWDDKYLGEKLIGITTTSLYGGYSQYTRLKYWRKCTSTEGKIPIEPSVEVYYKIRDWMKKYYPDELEKINGVSHPKGRTINFAYSKLDIKSRENDAPRGVYFASLYTKTLPFLRGETTDFGERLFDNKVGALFELWKTRHAENRIKNIMDSGRFDRRTLFYDGMIGMPWEDAKEKYLSDVGR